MSDKERRREWAEQQIKDHEREIEQLRLFLSFLDESDAALGTNGSRPKHSGRRMRRRRLRRSPTSKSFPDLVVGVLAPAGPEGLTAQEIADELERQGVKATGKTPLPVKVSSELNRQWKEERRGVTRISHGRYAVQQ